MKNIKLKKIRNRTHTKTKEKLKKILKLLIIKGYLYSIREARRQGLEVREIKDYLIKTGFVEIKKKGNPDGQDRFEMFFSEKAKKILDTTIKELIVYEDEKTKDFVKLLFCKKNKGT